MQGSTVVIRPPDGDLTAYLASIARVRDDRRVAPARPGARPRAPRRPARAAADVLAHRAARAAVVARRAARATARRRAAALRVHAYADVGPERDEVATATCWAHLLALVDEGAAASTAPRADPDAVFTAVVVERGAVATQEERT